MKKLLAIIVLGLLLGSCASDNVPDAYKLSTYTKERIEIIQKNLKINNIREIQKSIKKKRLRSRSYPPLIFYGVEEYEKVKKDIDYKFSSQKTLKTTERIIYLKTYGSTQKKAEASLISNCEKYKKNNNLDMDCFSGRLYTKLTGTGRFLDRNKLLYNLEKSSRKDQKEFEIKQAKIKKEIQEKSKVQKLTDNKKKCEEIGFTPQTDNFAKCVLKLIELAEIRESALIENSSRVSLESQIQQQQIKIQNQIAEEAKASRDQEAWKVLLGLTLGSNPGSSSSSNSNLNGNISCIKSGEKTSGTNKICYYNCMGSTKTKNVSSMSICPLNARL